MRYDHPLQTEVDSLQRSLENSKLFERDAIMMRDDAEARFVKVRAENDDLQQEVGLANKQALLAKSMYGRAQVWASLWRRVAIILAAALLFGAIVMGVTLYYFMA